MMDNNFKKVCRNVTGYINSDRKSLRCLLLSAISLTLVTATFITMTFSWFSITTSEMTVSNFVLDCGKGLRVNDSGTSELSFSKDVQQYITPASSVDGRNIFFPTDGSDFSSTTELMTFRSSNAGDKNKNYIQIDFTLTAQQDHTALYINDEKTSIKVYNGAEWSVSHAAALRSALWSSTAENGYPNTPIVFNPTKGVMRTAAVADVDRSNGAFIASGRQVAYTFSDYAFGGTPVATLSKGIETKFSYIIWLEGTDPKCTNSILNKDIEIKLAFTTSWDKTQTIRFEDQTDDYWVKSMINNNHYALSLRYDELDSNDEPTGSFTEFNMYSVSGNENQWSCNIPGDMRKNISFILRPKTGDDDITYGFTYNSQTPGIKTLDRGPNRLYIAKASAYIPNDNMTCQGYWMAVGDSDGAGHDSGNLDGDDF